MVSFAYSNMVAMKPGPLFDKFKLIMIFEGSLKIKTIGIDTLHNFKP